MLGLYGFWKLVTRGQFVRRDDAINAVRAACIETKADAPPTAKVWVAEAESQSVRLLEEIK